MSIRPLISMLAVLCLLAGAAVAAPLEAYGRLPFLEDAELSPDGSRIAFVTTVDERRLIALYSLKEQRLLSGVNIGSQKLRSIHWADDRYLLLTTSSTGYVWGLSGPDHEWLQMAAYDTLERKVRPLLQTEQRDVRTMNVVWGEPMVRVAGADTFVYLHGIYISDMTLPALFKVNLRTHDERVVRTGSHDTSSWLVDAAGKIVAEQGYNEQNRRWSIRLLRGERLEEAVAGVEAIDEPDILGFDARGDSIIVSRVEGDDVTWKPLSLRDGTWGAELAGDRDVNHIVLDPRSQRLVATAFIGDEIRYDFLDPELQERYEWLRRVLRGERVTVESLSADRSRALVRVTGPKSGYVYHFVDFAERVTTPVGSVYEGITSVAEVRPISYAAADGLEIPAYLTLPPGRPARNLPVIVLPHGGPAVRDSRDFDWWAQALAAQGYAVLQPNYRGSSLGQRWLALGFGEWGRKMQSDLSDGLRSLAAQGIVDPKRACIVGASYGGYAALAGVTLESGVYRCAVAVAGIADPREFLRWVKDLTRVGPQTSLRYWDRFLGASSDRDPRLAEISPIGHVASVTVPVMLIHGRDDTVVPYAQSSDMVKALKKAGKDVEFVSLAHEDHWLSRAATRLEMLKASVDFLRRHNPPD